MRISGSKLYLCAFYLIASSASALAQSSEPTVSLNRTDDGRGEVVITTRVPAPGMDESSDAGKVEATFDLGYTKGFGPNEQAYVNEDKSLIAVTIFPATQTSFAHLFMVSPQGDVTTMHSFNARVARLLRGKWAEAATYRLEVEGISGRNVNVRVVNYIPLGHEERRWEERRWTVVVSSRGVVSLAN